MSIVSHAKLKVGVAEGDITPPVGVANRLWGAAKHNTANGIHRPLRACVWVIKDDITKVLVGMDGSWWQGRKLEFICRKAIASAAQTRPDQVLLCLSHSHAAVPLLDEVHDGPGSKLLNSYLQNIAEQLFNITKIAASECYSSILQATYGCCSLAHHRDQKEGKGWIVGHDPHSLADQTIAIARLCHKDGSLRSVLVNYACHPTTLAWRNRLISPDFIGSMRENITQEHGVSVLFVQGASGDLAPARHHTNDPEVAEINGKCLALSVRSAISTLPPIGQKLKFKEVISSGAEIGVWATRRVELTSKSLIEHTSSELQWRKDFESKVDLIKAIEISSGPKRERLQRRLRIREQFGDKETIKIEAWGGRFGNIYFLGGPVENYSKIQKDIRDNLSKHVVIIANHCNGGSGYLIPKNIYPRKNYYPVWQSPFAKGSFEKFKESLEYLGEKMTLL